MPERQITAGGLYFNMSTSDARRITSNSLPSSRSPSTDINSNSPDARAHPPPPPPGTPPPTGAGGGYPVIPVADTPSAAAPPAGATAAVASSVAAPLATSSPGAATASPAAAPLLAASAAPPVPPADASVTPAVASPVDPANWAVPPASSWTPDAFAPVPPTTVADVVATWKADAQHTAPPTAAETATAQVAWAPSSLSSNATFPLNSTLTNSTVTNSTIASSEGSAPRGLAIAGIVIPLILSSLLLLLGISYCMRKRSRVTTWEPRSSDLEEGKASYRNSLSSSLLAARGAVDAASVETRVAYPGYDHAGVSVIPHPRREETREIRRVPVPTFNHTQASPIPQAHQDYPEMGDGEGGSVIYDEPASLTVPDLRLADNAYAAPNVLYSDGAGNILAPLSSLTPVRIVDTLAPPTQSSSSRCLTPRSALEVDDTLSELQPFSHASRSFLHPSAPASTSAVTAGSRSSTTSRRKEDWKCQDCGSAKLLRSASIDRTSTLFGSTYWTPSRRSTLLTESGGYEEVCSCPSKSVSSSSSERHSSRYPASTTSSSASGGRCSCSNASCSSTTISRPPPASLARQPRTRRRSTQSDYECGGGGCSGGSSPELPPSLRLGTPSSSSSSGSSSTCNHSHQLEKGEGKAAAKWLHHVNGSAYAGSIATEGHGHTCPSHSHHTRPLPHSHGFSGSRQATRSYSAQTARSADLPSPWAPLRPKGKKEEWRWERVPVGVYDALERSESRSTADTTDRMWRR